MQYEPRLAMPPCPSDDLEPLLNTEGDPVPPCEDGYRWDGESWVECAQCHRSCFERNQWCGARACPADDHDIYRAGDRCGAGCGYCGGCS